VRPEPGSNSPIKFIEEPIGSILFKEIILTFRSYISEEMLDPHIRFFLGCCSVFKVLFCRCSSATLIGYHFLKGVSTPFCKVFYKNLTIHKGALAKRTLPYVA
ncbi:MAG: hypothetical protein IKL58_02025, partial [Phascolarctobacterium sp.]|nr:hypothetical protein [Phascolarctobacterium sp.]